MIELQQSTGDAMKAQQLAFQLAASEFFADDNPAADNSVTAYESMSTIGVRYLAEFAQAENERRLTELRWLEDLRQFKGQYSPEILAKLGKARSKAFVRKTRVKVVTTDARVMDLLFPANAQKNWELRPTKKPFVPTEVEDEIKTNLATALGREADHNELQKAIKQYAEARADEMSSEIEDQLEECEYKEVAKQVLHSGHLFGTGVLKAPLVERKVRTYYVREPVVKDGKQAVNSKGKPAFKWVMKSESYVSPFVDFVPLWRFYPDMSATKLADCRYVYERHLFTKAAMLALAERKSFNSKAIIDYVTTNPEGHIKLRYIDTELRIMGERQATQSIKVGEYEVLERWGWIDGTLLLECGIEVPEERRHETFFGNVWLLPNGTVIKAALQPINGVTWPYHLYYFDKDETSIFAEGIAMVMRDDQDMINASTRMMFDNGAITAGAQLDVNVNLLAKGEKADEMHPFKIWPRTGLGEDAKVPAVRVLEIPGHLNELGMLREMSENNSDEVTAIPRYWQGENPSNGAAGTASGLSMLMGAVGIIAKNCVGAYDVVTTSFLKSMYRWNMQFNPNEDCKGDFDIVATGTSSLVAKEVRGQMLDQFAVSTNNPADAPYIKRDILNRERAKAHDLPELVKTEQEVTEDQNNEQAKAAAQLQQTLQQLQLATAQAGLAKLQAEIYRMSADGRRIDADAMQKRIGAVYEAMQAAGVAATNAHIAPAGDEILRAAGWADMTPAGTIGMVPPGSEQGAPQGGPVPPMPAEQGAGNIPPMTGPEAGPLVGHEAGMNAGAQTGAIGDGQVQPAA